MNKNEKLNARNYGSLLGTTVYRIVPEIVDLDYKKKVEDNKLRLTKPIYRFVPKKINITKTSLELGADGDHKIVFNDDPELRFPVSAELPKTSHDTIMDAITKFQAGDKSPMIFCPSETLIKELTALNNDSINIANKLAQELMDQAQSIKNGLKLDVDAIKAEVEIYSSL